MKEMEEHIGKLKQQLSEAEERYHRLDAEFASYRSAQSGKPEVKLQSEINLLTLEKVSTCFFFFHFNLMYCDHDGHYSCISSSCFTSFYGYIYLFYLLILFIYFTFLLMFLK